GAVGGNPEHPARQVVPGRQLVAPVGDLAPLRVLEELRWRAVERVGVDQAAAAHPGAGEHEHAGAAPAAQQGQPLDAETPQGRGPEEPAYPPGGPRQLVVGEPPAGLQHRHRVPLLGGAQRGHAAAEPGPDDHHVVPPLRDHDRDYSAPAAVSAFTTTCAGRNTQSPWANPVRRTSSTAPSGASGSCRTSTASCKVGSNPSPASISRTPWRASRSSSSARTEAANSGSEPS